jgi:hypothetical protein
MVDMCVPETDKVKSGPLLKMDVSHSIPLRLDPLDPLLARQSSHSKLVPLVLPLADFHSGFEMVLRDPAAQLKK